MGIGVGWACSKERRWRGLGLMLGMDGSKELNKGISWADWGWLGWAMGLTRN